MFWLVSLMQFSFLFGFIHRSTEKKLDSFLKYDTCAYLFLRTSRAVSINPLLPPLRVISSVLYARGWLPLLQRSNRPYTAVVSQTNKRNMTFKKPSNKYCLSNLALKFCINIQYLFNSNSKILSTFQPFFLE